MTSAPCAPRWPAISSRPQNAALLLIGYQPAPLPGSARWTARCWSRTPSRRSARNAVTPDAVTTLRAGTPPRTSAWPGTRLSGRTNRARTGIGATSTSSCSNSRVPAGTVAAVTDRAAPMSIFDYDARPVTPGVILVGTIGAELGQGQPVMIGAVAAEQRGLSRNRRRPSAHSAPMASDVLPDPDTPATATVRHSGTSASTSRRLSCRAARTPMTAGKVPRHRIITSRQAQAGAGTYRPRMRAVQGWTGPLGPRSRRSDCMMANVVVVVKTSMSAAASTPVYLAMMGAAARSVTASR